MTRRVAGDARRRLRDSTRSCGRRAPFDVHAEHAAAAAQHRRRARRSPTRRPGRRSARSSDLLVELASLRAGVAQQVDAQRRGDQPIHVDAGIDRAGAAKAPDEEPGGDQQQQRERDLGDDEDLLDVDAASRARRRHCSSFSAGTSDRPRGRERRHDAEQRCRSAPESSSANSEDAAIDREVERRAAARPAAAAPRGTPGSDGPGERHAGDAADQREQHALGQELPEQPAAARAEREPHRQLAPPSPPPATAAGWRCWRRRSAARRRPRRRAAAPTERSCGRCAEVRVVQRTGA